VTLVVYATMVFAPMLAETLVSRRNERALRQMGAVEPPDDVYAVVQVLYPALFAAILVEGMYRAAPRDMIAVAGFTIFVAAKLLKYWAVLTLGVRWTFRVLVPGDSARIVAGPYQWMRHPNYVAVLGEFAGAALFVHAFVTGVLALLSFGALIGARIRVEERALGLRDP
jgi:methyltransferase